MLFKGWFTSVPPSDPTKTICFTPADLAAKMLKVKDFSRYIFAQNRTFNPSGTREKDVRDLTNINLILLTNPIDLNKSKIIKSYNLK